MKVEYSEADRRPQKRRRRRHSKLKRIAVAIFSILLVLGFAVALMVTVFFNVTSVKVIGSSIYSSEDIIFASGIVNGDNLLRMSADKIEARIVKNLPYIKEAKIIKSFPDSVGIRVEPVEERYSIVTDSATYIADDNFKVLRVATQTDNDLTRVRGIKSESFTEGLAVNFADKQQRDVFNDILAICSEKGLNITYINIENLVDIVFAIDNKVLVKLGTYSNLAEKMTHLTSVLTTIDKEASLSISLKDYSVINKEAITKYEDISNYIK